MSNIPPDFTDIDPNEDHWVMTGVSGPNEGRRFPDPDLWCVPSTDCNSDMTDAMMSEIPGLDDVVMPRKMRDTRFWKFAMAYLMQDGNLGVPGGRYGRDTSTCAEYAIVMSLVMQYHNGEPITYYQLNSDMGSVVNSGDSVATLLSESQYIFDEESGIDVKELLGDEYEPQSKLEHLAKWAEVDIDNGDSVTITFDADAAERLVEAIESGEFKGRQD